jgi:hypothetical protein
VAPTVLWCTIVALGVTYGGLFLRARRPAAIRCGRVGIALLVVLAVRLVVVIVGYPLALAWEAVLIGIFLGGAVCLCLAWRVWLVRAGTAELRGQVQTGRRGLFLDCTEAAPGVFLLTAREGEARLRFQRLSDRMQLVVVPRVPGQGKLALFVHWLSKQYPGPVPRVRIILSRSAS